MFRDTGPRTNLGFGIPIQEDVEEGRGGNANFVQKALNGHPVMRFFAVAAASTVGMMVAGKVAREGGLRLVESAQKYAKSTAEGADKWQKASTTFRRIESFLDEVQGVSRDYVDADQSVIVKRVNGKLVRDTVTTTDSFHIRMSNIIDRDPSLSRWSNREAIQQRLVAQARRLPYEAPAFYVAQKALIDPLVGSENPKDKVNWKNPVDVIGDFAYQSIKNLAVNIMPFDLAGGAASNTYRNTISKMSQNPTGHLGYTTLRTVLEQVGVDASELMNRTVKFSHQTAGAFSSMIDEANTSSKSIKDWIRSRKNTTLASAPTVGNASFASRTFAHAKAAVNDPDSMSMLLDTLPGPFKGMGSGIKKASKTFKDTGKMYDDYQDLLAGRLKMKDLRLGSDVDKLRYTNLLNYMRSGGGTSLEQWGKSLFKLGDGGPTLPGGLKNPKWSSSPFYQARMDHAYKATLIDELTSANGLSYEEATKFLSLTSKATRYSSGSNMIPGGKLEERFHFGANEFHGQANEWWDHVVKIAGAHNPTFNDPTKISKDFFAKAVRNADIKFSSRNNQSLLKAQIKGLWGYTHDEIAMREAGNTITPVKRAFDLFTGPQLQGNAQFLIRRSAQRMGLDILDSAGNPIPIDQLKLAIHKRGFNPDNLQSLRGFLVDKKDINVPWNKGRKNIFGFQPLTIESALQKGFFSGNDAGTQREIRQIINKKTGVNSPFTLNTVGQSINNDIWNLRLNRVYEMANGKILDLNRVTRAFTHLTDKIASDYQIPLLHLNPLQVGGHSARQAMRNQPPILIEDGLFNSAAGNYRNQPFLGKAKTITGAAAQDSDIYVWTKSTATKSKGKVFGVSSDTQGGFRTQEFRGLFRPNSTNPLNMLGRYGNIYTDHQNVPSSKNQPNKWKRLFNVSYNQENNLMFGSNSVTARWYRALTNKEGSTKNPHLAAKKVVNSGTAGFTANDSEGWSNLVNTLRSHGFSPRFLRELADSKDPKLAAMFGLKDPLGNNILDTPEELLPSVIKKTLENDIETVKNAGGKGLDNLYQFQQQLKTLLSQGDKQIEYWNLPAPENIKTTGISRRIDQLKGELYDYLAVRSTAMPGAQSADFNGTIQTLLAKLDESYTKGSISSAEKAEGRAAVLSLQIEHARNITYQSGDLSNFALTQNIKTIDHLLGNGVEAKQLLNEVADFASINHGARGPLRKLGARLTASEPYTNDLQINSATATNTFVPTFGTAFANNPRKAMSGLVNNWKDPEAVSGLSTPMTHMVMRLNTTLEMFNVGLDPNAFKGPMSFYAKGIVGKRALPLYAAGATALTVDRTIGGTLNDEDERGNKVYSPYFTTKLAGIAVAAQVGAAGLIPGGQTAEQKRAEIESGEVPIRAGRFWALGNTPFKGGRIQYFRPSWYQRLKSGSSFTPEMNETPLERLAFGYDFSPLRPLDPYRRERQDYESRPYPLTGEYFTGPWGPLTGALNATVGRLLKPQKRMHEAEVKYGLSQYAPVGMGGAYMAQSPINSVGYQNAQQLSSINSGYMNAAGGGYTPSSGPFNNAMGYTPSRGGASLAVRRNATAIAGQYQSMANSPATVPYAPVTQPGTMTPRVISSEQPLDYNSLGNSVRRVGYQAQELTGIYGFGTSSIREKLGFGNADLAPNQAILESASRGYSASRSFWNLNLGGLGDFPLPIEGKFANLELSEIARRFVPKEQGGVDFINPIPNLLGKQYPWLPGADYPLMNVKTGDPYNKASDMEIRLPGTGYLRTHAMYPDQYGGEFGLANIHDILGDIAPWSPEYKAIDGAVGSANLPSTSQAKIIQTRAQVEAMRYKNEFTPYEHRYQSLTDIVGAPASSSFERGFEWLAHRDSYLNTKLGAPRTAVEDWERDNVYGATFPKWQTPYTSFIKPTINKLTQRNPISSALSGGGLGFLFGKNKEARMVGSVIGGLIGGAAGTYGNVYEAVTGRRFIPMERKKEVALEENIDILTYTRSKYLESMASKVGDAQTAEYFAKQAKSTMYGADLNSTPEQLAMAVPKRKREHFRAMMFAPEQEREQILSTAGRLERRLYQAAWGQKVEQLPDLNEYYKEHELPPPDADVWNPSLNMDTIKIKMGQSLGLDMAQMGFFPQQVQEANLINPSYPAFEKHSSFFSSFSIKAQLKRLLSDNNISGSVRAMPSPYSDSRIQLNAGTY